MVNKQLQICISVYLCVNISLMLNTLIVYYYLIKVYGIVGQSINHRLYRILGTGRPVDNIRGAPIPQADVRG